VTPDLNRMPRYEDLNRDELLHVAVERDQLTDEARMELDIELSLRNISTADVNSYRLEYEMAEHDDKVRAANRLTRPSFASSRGFGFKFLGKMNYHRDPSDRFEEYDSTQWFTTFWLPIFPVATFKVRRDRSRWLGIPWKSGPQALERYPRNWNQILLTWIKTMALLVVLRLTYLWLLKFPR
jgi:hypothetical protein